MSDPQGGSTETPAGPDRAASACERLALRLLREGEPTDLPLVRDLLVRGYGQTGQELFFAVYSTMLRYKVEERAARDVCQPLMPSVGG